jgi:hypothetical protein
MSRARTVGLAVVILIASAFLVAAHNTPKTIAVANHPAITGKPEPQSNARLSLAPSTAAASAASAGVIVAPSTALPLAENAYDFNNIDGIPGFGTLPPAYDSRPVMPRIGSP